MSDEVTITRGGPLPDLTLDGPDVPVTLESLRGGKPMVVIFYTEDATPTCTAQLCQFRDEFALLEEIGATVVAISKDDQATHARFSASKQFPFPLLSDPDLRMARAFGVVDEEIQRSVRAIFITDAGGKMQQRIMFYSPYHPDQFLGVFKALGADL